LCGRFGFCSKRKYFATFPVVNEGQHLYSRIIYRFLFVFLFLYLPLLAQAQVRDTSLLRSNIRIKTIGLPFSDSIYIDTLSVASGSFSISGIPDSAYTFFPEQGLLVWKTRPATDSLKLQYRVLPFLFIKKRAHKQTDAILTSIPFTSYYNYKLGDTTAKGFVDFNSIEYNGTYGRSLTVGNSQDVSLNSNFNLQLNGYILDSVRIEAAVTDNNIPIQPDGNTQQIQEFDRIYITFEKGHHKLTAILSILRKGCRA
jgi:hypothetical protein